MAEKDFINPPIPYARNARPLRENPWNPSTLKSPEPHSYEAYFTNPDPRMRPREHWAFPQRYFTAEEPRLEVTPRNFPELHAKVQSMFNDAGITPYRIHLYPALAGAFHINHYHRELKLSARQLARQDFDSMIGVIGHEVGHAWRQQTPERPRAVIRSGEFHWYKHDEIQADMFATCLLGSREDVLRGLKNISPDTEVAPHYPSRAQRRDALQAMEPMDCGYFGITPPALRKPTPTKKARD